ncbi:MAG: hypothetical protein Q7U73_09265 [Rubrivivax sp.]|nr:hypothetical protein [Rubrivivax sp.]
MHHTFHTHPALATATTLAAALLLGACASVQPARMALPAGLDAHTEPLPVQGLGGKRRGELAVGAARGSFDRNADQLSVFGMLDFDRGGARYTLHPAGAAEVEAQCRQRQTGGQVGILALPLRPYAVSCQWRDGARLTLEADPRAARTQEGRLGRYEGAGVQLQLSSVHRLQGSKLPVVQPAGYTFTHQGVVVGAVDLTESARPLLWRPPAGQPLHDAVTHAALALALMWEPAGRQP